MDLDAIYQKGFEFRCSGNYSEARAEFAKILAVDDAHFQSQHQLGLIQGFEGDFDGSLLTLEALCKNHPENIEVRYDLAMTQMMLGMSEQACENFKKILEIDPLHEKALQQAAFC